MVTRLGRGARATSKNRSWTFKSFPGLFIIYGRRIWRYKKGLANLYTVSGV